MKQKFTLQHHGSRRVVASLALACFLPTIAYAVDTGFLQTDGGPYDYNDTANWVGGTINGIWDISLTTTAVQAITFGADTALPTGLTIGYTGNSDLNFTSGGVANRTLTLGSDITIAPVSNRTITIGSGTANTGLNVALGGNRTFTVAGARVLRFFNPITGGNLTISGATASSGGAVRLNGNNGTAAGSDVTVNQFAQLFFGSDVSGNTGATRAQNVTLTSGGNLFLQGNNGVNSVDTISGNLTIDGAGYTPSVNGGTIPSIGLRNGTKNTLLAALSFARQNHGLVFIKGTNLGLTSIASATVNNTNFQVTGAAPTLVGGSGAAGSTTISMIPWAVGATSYASTAPTTFVTYDAANGFRPLETATEFASAVGGSATDNVRLTATSDTVISGAATVNSLILSGSGGSISGTGALTVTSGAILMTRTTGAGSVINKDLNFGTAEGIISYVRGDVINGAVAGSGGLTLLGNRTDEAMQMKSVSSTYTGDTYVLGNMQVVAGFLPSGARSGNVYVSGNLQLDVGGFTGSINGLSGTGTVRYGNSGAAALSIGDNDTTATFAGSIIANTNLKIYKIGTGTQTLAGVNSGGTTTVSAGTLSITGSLASSTVTVNSNATLKGTGTITGIVNAAGTVAPGTSVGTLTTGAANLTGTLAIEVNGTTCDKLLSSGVIDLTAATLIVTPLGSGFNQPSYIIAEGTSITGSISVPSGYAVNIQVGGVGQQAVLTSTGGGGGYGAWKSNVGNQSPSEDYNNDGVSNGIAYFMNNTGVITLPGIVGGAVTWTNGGNIPTSAYETQYVVQTSPDLVHWSPVLNGALTANSGGPGGSLTYSLPSGMGKLFARLVVTPQ